MPQAVMLKAAGLHTFKNQLSAIPEGALETAINVIIDRDGIIEPRRGFAQYTDTPFANRAKQLLEYKKRLLTHHGTTLSFETSALDGTFSDFSGTFNEVEVGKRIRGIESNGNLYFTSSDGVQKMSAATNADFTTGAGFITLAGGPKALNLDGTVDYSIAGFLSEASSVSYRLVWGKKDNNDNLILGSPSARFVIENKDPVNSGVVNLTSPIPKDVTDISFFYQLYRSPVVNSPIAPSDELQLVFEEFVTTAELAAGFIGTTTTFQDVTPEDFRINGAFLYSNPVSGDGIEQANEPPPFAKDIELYKGYTFYANTASRQNITLSLLGIPGIVSGDSISIADGTTTRTYTFRGAIETYTADFSGIGAKATLDGKRFTLASANDEIVYKIWFDDTGTTVEPILAGTSPIKIDTTGTPDTPNDVAQKVIDDILAANLDFNGTNAAGVLTITTANNGNIATVVSSDLPGFVLSQDSLGDGEDLTINDVFLARVPTSIENGPSTSQQIDQTARSMVKVINADTSGIINAFYISGVNDVPGQIFFEQRTLVGPQFNIYASNLTVAGKFNPTLGIPGPPASNETKVQSSNEVKPNRIFFSKFQQPESVPLVNFIDIGPKDQEIRRIVALRDSLFIFKDNGIYRLSGDVAPFSVAPFDFSLVIEAPDSAVVLNNQIHVFTTQGIVQVTDTGVSVISRSIEDQLLEVSRDGFSTNTASFGVPYEKDRSYLFFTVKTINDTTATQCFRFNSFTNTWTIWDLNKTCGLVNTRDGKLYFGAADINILEKERKSLTRTDHADRQFAKQVIASGDVANRLTISSLVDVDIGDAIIQTQYVTIAQYNRIINQLRVDSGIADPVFGTLISNGVRIRTAVTQLATDLDANPNTTTTYSSLVTASVDFATIQAEYNAIIDAINIDSGIFFSTYDRSNGTIDREVVILSIDETLSNTVVISIPMPFTLGLVTHYKSIKSNIIYAPQSMGDPSIWKQVSEGTYLFEDNNFTLATVGYKSDLSPGIETINFSGSGVGDWGTFNWGQINWGGVTSAKPLRTLIPLGKQRCRYLQPQFKHSVAFEKWSLVGISLTPRPYSQRAYK